MAKIVAIEGVGNVEFPDSMSDADISAQAAKAHAGANKPGFLDSARATAKEYWNRLVKPIVDASQYFSADPAAHEKAVDALTGFAHGVRDIPLKTNQELGETGKAIVRADIPAVAYHAAGAVPVLGPQSQEIAQDVGEGRYSDALAHTAVVATPFAAGPAIDAAAEIPGAVARGAKATGSAVADVATNPALVNTVDRLGNYAIAGGAMGMHPKAVMAGVSAKVAARALKAAGEARVAAAAEEAASIGAQRVVPSAPMTIEAPPLNLADRPVPVATPAPYQRTPIPAPNIADVQAAEASRAPAAQPVQPIAATDPALLEQLARSLADKSFSKLTPEQQEVVRGTAARLNQPAPAAPVTPQAYVPRDPSYYGVTPTSAKVLQMPAQPSAAVAGKPSAQEAAQALGDLGTGRLDPNAPVNGKAAAAEYENTARNVKAAPMAQALFDSQVSPAALRKAIKISLEADPEFKGEFWQAMAQKATANLKASGKADFDILRPHSEATARAILDDLEGLYKQKGGLRKAQLKTNAAISAQQPVGEE